jgi:hypothetical protein
LSAKYPTAETDPVAEADLAAKGISRSGLLASRPAAASGNSGLLYFATDDNGGTLYRSDGSTWTKIAASVLQSSGAELGYAEITTPQSTTTTGTYIDIAGLSVTVTVGSRPIVVRAFTPNLGHSAVTAFNGYIREGSTDLVFGQRAGRGAGEQGEFNISRRLAPSAGSHTYKVSMLMVGAGTMSFAAAATAPAYIQVLEA